MPRIFYATIAGLCALAFSLPEKSVSTSQQFVVYGNDFRLRGAICDLAEQTKRDLLRLTNQRDEWAAPIVIYLQAPQANLPEMPPASLTLAQTGFSLKVQLNLKITSDLTQREIRHELLKSILLELIYRHTPNLAPGLSYLTPPEWLLLGIEGKISGAVGPFAHPIFIHGPGSLQEFLLEHSSPADLPGRASYQTGSIALIELLLDQHDGRQRLASLISGLALTNSDDPTIPLRTHFPELFDPEKRLQEAWLAKIEQLSTKQTSQLVLNGQQTKRALDAILSVDMSGDKNSRATYRLLDQQLNALALSANPLYRPIITEYQKLARELARGKTTDVSQRIARLRLSQQAVKDRCQNVADYLNWFEATHSRQPSGLFSGYLKAIDDSGEVRRRHDPISVYLDALEIEFENASPCRR